MNVKLFGLLCFLVLLNGGLSGSIPNKDVNTKPDDEDVYGDLGGNDPELQQDQDYYTDVESPEPAPEEDTSDNEIDTKLVSKPEVFVQTFPSIVLLPCQTSSSGDPVRVWTKDTTLIYQGSINVQNNEDLKLFDNGTLQVHLRSKYDYGKYTCKLIISDDVQPEVTHEVIGKASPSIQALYANDNRTTVFNPGETLVLTCKATGYPKPRISWHRNERLGTEGETLTIQPVQPKHAGSYRCLADNSFGKPDHKHIDIYVNHAPTVSVEKYVVNSAHESDAELICEVRAYPAPMVNWQKDGQILVNNEPKIKIVSERNNKKNLLIIKNISEDDFGEYTCVASNGLGTENKTVALVQTPALRPFERLSNESTKDIILQWRVESKQPISSHELQYRRKGENSWNTISPKVSKGDNDVYLIKHTLKNLEPGVYETRARSANSQGWSDYSDIMAFEGDPTHDTPAQHRSEEISPVGESTTGRSTTLNSSIFLISLTLFATYFHVRQ